MKLVSRVRRGLPFPISSAPGSAGWSVSASPLANGHFPGVNIQTHHSRMDRHLADWVVYSSNSPANFKSSLSLVSENRSMGARGEARLVGLARAEPSQAAVLLNARE